MDALVFSMAGIPRGKGRPRATVRGGFASVYTDDKTRKYEASITKLARDAMGARPPLEGALSVSLRFRVPIPAGSKARRAAMAAGEIAPVTRPDVDNMAKAVLDAIGEDAALKRKLPIGQRKLARVMFVNDWQIVRLFVTKVYAENPGVDVRIEPLEPQAVA